ncbi:MAG: porin [Proteobacteria bacterium]|nr:porin [Pseudomonadota bacterium]
MQKKLIALAVAGLVSVPAFAQSNVTIYGIVDMGYAYRGDNVVDGVKNRNGIDSGIANGSRLGFKGTEDLGNGLKAGFVLEQGIAVDTGTSTQDGKTFGRQSFAYLGGNFGTVALGRQYAPQFVLLDSLDPFSTGQVGASNNIYSIEVRLDNLVSYTSPSWNGFNVVAGYTFSAAGNESRGNNSAPQLVLGDFNAFGDARVWAINPNYKNGPLQVGVNYHQATLKAANSVGGITNDLAFADGKKVKVWDIGGSYDLGVVKLAAMFGQRKADSDAIGDFLFNPLFKKSTQWLVGATVPVGPSGKVLLSYVHRKSELTDGAATELGTNDDAKSGQWALGYEYALSKRTSIYTAYSDINNKGSAKATFEGAPVTAASVGDATSDGGGYQRGFNLGLRHVF